MKGEAIAINCVDMVWGAQAFIYENFKVYTHPNSREKRFPF